MLLDDDFWPTLLIPLVYQMTSCLEASRFFPLHDPLVGYESRGKERKKKPDPSSTCLVRPMHFEAGDLNASLGR